MDNFHVKKSKKEGEILEKKNTRNKKEKKLLSLSNKFPESFQSLFIEIINKMKMIILII